MRETWCGCVWCANRQLDPPATGWELHTGPAGLPCRLATAWLPQLKQLGNECIFQGSVWSEQNGSKWEAEVSGSFEQLDLDCLISRRFPHKLSGIAQVVLSRLVIHQSHISEMAGRVQSAGGVISRSLLESAGQCLNLTLAPRSEGATKLQYNKLAVQFSLSKEGLALAPASKSTEKAKAQSLLTDAQGPLLSAAGPVHVSSLALVRVLVPQSDVQVPVARETTALLQALPWPEITPSTSANARRSYQPLRFRMQ